jgi:hypothetical protein
MGGSRRGCNSIPAAAVSDRVAGAEGGDGALSPLVEQDVRECCHGERWLASRCPADGPHFDFQPLVYTVSHRPAGSGSTAARCGLK